MKLTRTAWYNQTSTGEKRRRLALAGDVGLEAPSQFDFFFAIDAPIVDFYERSPSPCLSEA